MGFDMSVHASPFPVVVAPRRCLQPTTATTIIKRCLLSHDRHVELDSNTLCCAVLRCAVIVTKVSDQFFNNYRNYNLNGISNKGRVCFRQDLSHLRILRTEANRGGFVTSCFLDVWLVDLHNVGNDGSGVVGGVVVGTRRFLVAVWFINLHSVGNAGSGVESWAKKLIVRPFVSDR